MDQLSSSSVGFLATSGVLRYKKHKNYISNQTANESKLTNSTLVQNFDKILEKKREKTTN